MSDDRIPPHDPVAERCVLFSCMADDNAFYAASAILAPSDFYNPNRGLMYKAMIDNDTGDMQVLKKTLSGEHWFEELLSDTFEARITCNPSLIVPYCQILKELTAKRHALSAGLSLTEATGSESPAELSERLHRAADEIQAKAPESLGDPVKQLFSDLDDAVNGLRYSAPIPWEMLAADTRALLPGTVTILCGSPGATKSLALVQWARHLMDKRVPICLLALEDGVSYHLRRAAAQILGIADLTDDGWCRGNPDKVADIKRQLGPTLTALKSVIEAPAAANKCGPDNLLAWLRQKARSHRVVAVDPITMMTHGAKPWTDDEKFLFGAKRIIEGTGSSLVLITHPRKMQQGANRNNLSMDDLAGGVAYSRFSQTVLLLLAHEPKENVVERQAGALNETYNRTMVILKARNGRGAEGHRFAFRFDPKTLTLTEVGRIRKD